MFLFSGLAMWPVQSAYCFLVLLYYRIDVLFFGFALVLMAVLFMANMAATVRTSRRNTERRRAAALWFKNNGAQTWK